MRRAIAVLFCFTTALAAIGPGPVRGGELIVNGGFETGSFGTSWVHGAYRRNNYNPNFADHLVVLDLPYSGNYSALLGFKYTPQVRSTHAFMYQEVSIPTGISQAVLNFKIRMQGYDSDYYDPFIVEIRDGGNNPLERVTTLSFSEWNDKFKDSGWISDDDQSPEGYDLSAYAGQTVRIYFDQANLYDDLYETWTYVDEVSLVYRKFVDLMADGDGDDEFGDPSTGLGAFSSASGVAGDTLKYVLTVENEGTLADTYQLSANPPGGWTVLLDDGAAVWPFPYTTGSIPAGYSANYTVLLIPPPAAGGGSYDCLIDAVSTTQASRFDSATLRANVLDAHYGADLVVDGNGFGVIGKNGDGGFAIKEAVWDSVLTFNLELFNTGSSSTAYDVWFVTIPGATASVWYGGTQYTAPFITSVVADGSSAAMTLEVEVPSPEPGGDYATVVNARAVADTLKMDSIEAVLRLRAPRADMIIATSGDGVYDGTFSGLGGSSSNAGERGVEVSFPVTVQNESSLPDSFTLDWVAPGAGWTAVLEVEGADRSFPVLTPVFAPFSQDNYALKVTIPAAAAYGTYRSILNLVSGVDSRVSESVAASLSVSSPSEIDISIDGEGVDVYGPVGTGLGGTSIKNAAPGDTVVFVVTIENVSGTDAFDLEWNTPPGWVVTLGGQPSPVSGMPAGTYNLEVVVPPASLGGTFDIIVDGRKTDKPFFMDSVTGRVIVAPPAVVDGLIDGNGDELFGDLGTGMGGLSLQVTSAPASVNFTVEVQNQGPQADQYTVSWNSIPLWNATLDGSSSPLTTSMIAAGGSDLFTFEVTAPASALVGNYAFFIDIQSLVDSTSFESLEAAVTVVGPPRVDLIVDGNGAGLFGPLGSGQGGWSLRSCNAGSAYSASLRVQNVGSFPDSFRIDWQVPAGWPAGSILIDDGVTGHNSAFWTARVLTGQFLDYTIQVQIPAGLGTDGVATIIDAWSGLPPNLPESIQLITKTNAAVRGVVFHDVDHDLGSGPGDSGIGGVRVVAVPGSVEAMTGGDGSYVMSVPGGTSVTVIEYNPSGYISLSPDTLGPFVVDAGDTAVADFADVPPLYVSAGGVKNGLAGGYVDFPHTVEAGTAGHVDLAASNDVGAVIMFLLDENGNGVFDGNDRALVPADTDLDPAAGNALVAVLMRVFVPVSIQPGTTVYAGITAVQTITGTPLTSTAAASDAVVVVGSAVGRLTMVKAADKTDASPGETITYSVRFFNAGVDSIQNVVLYDPVSPWVDPLADGFGPGLDVEWRPAGSPPVYLTFDNTDGDECDYNPPERLLRLILSRTTPFYLAPGESGFFAYKVQIR